MSASIESEDAMKARHAAADAAAAARTAVEVARLTAAGLAGQHDRLAVIKREAAAQLRAACRTADRAKGDGAMATLSAVHVLEPLSLRLGVASRWEWRARSRRVRLLARLALAFLPKLTRELEPHAMARDVCGARALRVPADVPADEREQVLAWAVASVAIEAVRGRVRGVGPTLEHDAAELLAAKLVARCARRSKVRAVPGSSTPGTTAKGGGPRPRRSPVVRRVAPLACPRPVRPWGLAGVARGLVALVVALVVLVGGEASGYAAQENAPTGWQADGARDQREGKLEMAATKSSARKSAAKPIQGKRPPPPAPVVSDEPSTDKVRASLCVARDAIRDLSRRGRGAPTGLGFLLERYLDAPGPVDLMTGDALAKRLRLASYRADGAERGEIVRELLAGADRLVNRAARIAEGEALPDEAERRRLRIAARKGEATKTEAIRKERFLKFARMCGLLVTSEPFLSELADTELTWSPEALESEFSPALRELYPSDRAGVTLEIVRDVGAAWNETDAGRPRVKGRGKWERLGKAAKTVLGLTIAPRTLKNQSSLVT